MPLDASYAAPLIDGKGTFDVVIPLALTSLMSEDAAAPVSQLSDAAKLYVAPPSELVPSLFNKPPTLSWSFAFKVTRNEVFESTSTSPEVSV